MFARLLKWSETINKLMAILATALTVGMILLMTVNVIMQKALNTPIPGVPAIATQILVATVYLSITYVQQLNRHIKVDIFMERLSPRGQATMRMAGDIIVLVTMSLLAWRVTLDMIESWVMGGAEMGAIDIPFAPLWTVLTAGLINLSVYTLLHICARLTKQELAKS